MKLAGVALALSLMAGHALAAEFTVEMKNSGADGTMVFEPAIVKAQVGDTINFVPTDMGHNAQSIEGLIPEGAAGWKGKMNKPVSVTLDKEGVFVFSCRPHQMMAMVGVIVAGEPVNLDAVKAQAATLSSTFVMNKERLNGYLEQIAQ